MTSRQCEASEATKTRRQSWNRKVEARAGRRDGCRSGWWCYTTSHVVYACLAYGEYHRISIIIINIISFPTTPCKPHLRLLPYSSDPRVPTCEMSTSQLSSDEIQKLCSDLVYQVAYSFYDVPYIIILKMLVQYNVYVPKTLHVPLLLIYNKNDRNRFGSKGRALSK